MSSQGYRLAVLNLCENMDDYEIELRGVYGDLDKIVGERRTAAVGDSVRNRRWTHRRGRTAIAKWKVYGDNFAIQTTFDAPFGESVGQAGTNGMSMELEVDLD